MWRQLIEVRGSQTFSDTDHEKIGESFCIYAVSNTRGDVLQETEAQLLN